MSELVSIPLRVAGLLDLHTLEVRKVGLLVERGGLETESRDNVVDLCGLVVKSLLGLLSGSVGTSVYDLG